MLATKAAGATAWHAQDAAARLVARDYRGPVPTAARRPPQPQGRDRAYALRPRAQASFSEAGDGSAAAARRRLALLIKWRPRAGVFPAI